MDGFEITKRCFNHQSQQKFRCKNEILHKIKQINQRISPGHFSNMDHFKNLQNLQLPRPREHIRAMMAMVMTKMLSNVPSAQAMRQMPPSKKLPNWARFRPTIFSIFQLPTNLLLWTNGWLKSKGHLSLVYILHPFLCVKSVFCAFFCFYF